MEHPAGLRGLPPLLQIVLICLLITFLTEVASPTAIATMMMSIMAFTAPAMGIHPYLLMLPADLSASCAFMLPSATPPNALLFATGLIRLPQMTKTGLALNLLGVILITLSVYFLGSRAFEINLLLLSPRAAPP